MAKSIFKEDPKHPDAPKVFISYSCDSKEHEQWVKKLTTMLRTEGGANAITYLHVLSEQPNLNKIMIQGFEQSDKVIIVGTKKYVQRAKDNLTGVGYESKLATIIERESPNKLVLIKRDICDFNESVIFPFSDNYITDFTNDIEYSEKFNELIKRIWNIPLEPLSQIGNKPNFEQTSSLYVEQLPFEKLLEKCNVVAASLNVSSISKDTLVLWPIVPRPKLTIIHFAQMELLEKLAKLGCHIHVIIADCGSETSNIHRDAASFKNLLDNVLKKRGLTNYNIELLSTYFGKESPNPVEILKGFIGLSEGLTVGQLMLFNLKKDFYNEDAQKKVKDQSTLKMMSTIFMWTACVYESVHNPSTEAGSIVVAGFDENKQWSHIFDINKRMGVNMGALYIKTLTQDDAKSVYQPDIWNGYNSKEELEEEFGTGNLDWWVTQYFLKLKCAPESFSFKSSCSKSKTCSLSECDECIFQGLSTHFPDYIDKKMIATMVFERMNPAQ